MLKRIGLYLLVALAACALGISLGGAYTKGRQSAAAATQLEARTRYLQSNIHGIEVGSPFPDIPLWKPDGVSTVQLRDLLPHGGLVLYTSGDCPSCIETVRALGKTIRATGHRIPPAIVVAEGDPARIVDIIAKDDLSVALARDSQQTLFRDYGVVTFPSYFLLDERQTVKALGATQGTSDEFTKLFKQWKRLGETN